ncbi:phospholipase A2 inhibitor and Ly6/PLAUR domain-containing protein-like [Sardina pilchardus]|uniref:phospholipase A2 inhibitor and Ly6/PLAUR domain-containing protein-like n=1 Tax=Sardina pilchardus TaxID=27697 RepID=UPI002E144955
MKGSIVLGFLCTIVCEVAALSCYFCEPDITQKCNNSVPCTGTCASVTEALYKVGITELVTNSKCCLQTDHCISGSINLGVLKRTFNVQCCGNNHCNTRSIPEFNTDNTPNGKKCYTCDDNDCTKTMSCVGDEDRCIKTTIGSEEHEMIMKGCASSSICNDSATGLIGAEMECCEGNLCNSPKGLKGQIALILLGSLLSVVIVILSGVLLGLHLRSQAKCNYCSTSSIAMSDIDNV